MRTETVVGLNDSRSDNAAFSSGQLARSVVAFLLMCLAALAWALVAPTPAYAVDDQIDSFMINYEMQPSGVLKQFRPPWDATSSGHS
jgi:hypothetical protein